MGYFIARSRIWESVALILIAFTLFRPGFWMDRMIPPLEEVAPTELFRVAGEVPAGGSIRLAAAGMSIEGDEVAKTVLLPLGDAGEGEARLLAAGLELRDEDGKIIIDNIGFASPAEKLGLDFDFEITGVYLLADRPAKEWLFIPALLFLGLVIWIQRRRLPARATPVAASPAGGD